jgi:hypothetical protein
MQLPISQTSEDGEVQRLKALLSPELKSHITVAPCEHKNYVLIATKRFTQEQFLIQIDFQQWCFFTTSQRDLLFWHEVARVQNRAIVYSSWELIAISIGLSAALMELISHSLVAFLVALTVTGLSAHKLYQRKLGEQSLREVTAADQTAIALAMQFGYSFVDAYSNLYEALSMLAKQPSQKSRWSKYQVRLQVLEMLANQSNESQPLALNFVSVEHHANFSRKIQNPVF